VATKAADDHYREVDPKNWTTATMFLLSEGLGIN
jgi:hypothetical protein